MKCLVVSDSHGDRDVLVRLLHEYRGKVDTFFTVVILSYRMMTQSFKRCLRFKETWILTP
ncbi:hypothetical protein AGMB00912_01958 [Lactiplantibacillus argentoratensis]